MPAAVNSRSHTGAAWQQHSTAAAQQSGCREQQQHSTAAAQQSGCKEQQQHSTAAAQQSGCKEQQQHSTAACTAERLHRTAATQHGGMHSTSAAQNSGCTEQRQHTGNTARRQNETACRELVQVLCVSVAQRRHLVASFVHIRSTAAHDRLQSTPSSQPRFQPTNTRPHVHSITPSIPCHENFLMGKPVERKTSHVHAHCPRRPLFTRTHTHKENHMAHTHMEKPAACTHMEKLTACTHMEKLTANTRMEKLTAHTRMEKRMA
eukprot:363326-Chlamydomonas_euryale.AAC.5